jgi:hypothetical protein
MDSDRLREAAAMFHKLPSAPPPPPPPPEPEKKESRMKVFMKRLFSLE